MRMRGLLSLIGIIVMAGCTGMSETLSEGNPTLSPTPTPVFNCSYYSMYDSMTDCQNGTFANCTWEWKAFPSGGSSVCYAPLAGWESCAATATDWIYTSWSMVCREAGNTYHVARSVVNCSSTVCACLNPQVIQASCTDGVDCPVSIPIPSPTPNCP